ncbi:MAG: hypothetical protein OEW98_00270 [Betaproteobacteria bacterium]|nr:hypothetical protein [Betaproteobacteria bacterium]
MTDQELIWSAVVAWMSAKGIEIAKRLTWLPIDTTTERLNRWVARAVALVATVGIHATFDGEAGRLVIDGLTLSGLTLAVGEYAKQVMLTQIAYKKFVKGEDV